MAKAQVYRVRLSEELAARLRARAEAAGTNLSGALALELDATSTMPGYHNGEIGGVKGNVHDNSREVKYNGSMLAMAPKRGPGRPKTKVRKLEIWLREPLWKFVERQSEREKKTYTAIIEEALEKASKK